MFYRVELRNKNVLIVNKCFCCFVMVCLFKLFILSLLSVFRVRCKVKPDCSIRSHGTSAGFI